MLGQATPEIVWQRFFAGNPFVLSRGLPLRLLPCDILPFGRQGRSEPDFLLFPGSEASERIYGVVELKTDYTRIVTRPRKTELILSREAATAVSQVATYDALYDTFAPRRRIMTLESMSHLFIIMGERRELEEIEEAMLPRLKQVIPPGIRFLTFDDLYESFDRGLPKPVAILERAPNTIQRPLPLGTSPLINRVIRELSHGPLTGKEIHERVGVATVSIENVVRQLHGLRAAGLIESQRKGRNVVNTLSDRGAAMLAGLPRITTNPTLTFSVNV